ncbi:hypothetical protein DI396_12700 [Litorivita pollutaquae]|uniref:WGR domain-containing protein n=1 Tax=Litorivita pollutaquae TaxID=2200892 RepID=A0A2V4MKC2_9RHOB|nr:WGR domain-containing protein [Litorivita pollutaquae]OUS19849.1 hypothetical protein A9Q95_12535 [Rhodobacterales bacterium 59_46_T64]PYC47065.1 hypothetical protein DI396_12700 [Litorivita pollutaquae]
MTCCLMYQSNACGPARYYRVEIALNLFEEVSVLREWGHKGGKGRMEIAIFANLRHASEAADRWRERALKRGYDRAA